MTDRRDVLNRSKDEKRDPAEDTQRKTYPFREGIRPLIRSSVAGSRTFSSHVPLFIVYRQCKQMSLPMPFHSWFLLFWPTMGPEQTFPYVCNERLQLLRCGPTASVGGGCLRFEKWPRWCCFSGDAE